jgi:hypothetical protein
MHNLSIYSELNLWNQIFPEFTLEDYVFILPPANILGDSYIPLGFIESFEKYRRKKVYIAASGYLSAHKKAIDLFSFDTNKVQFLEKESFDMITEIYCNGPYIIFLDKTHKRFFANQLASIVHPGFGSDVINWIQKGISLYDLYKIHLNLDSKIIFNHHQYTSQQDSRALELFNQFELKLKKSVIIFPDTNSIKWNNIEFINDLVDLLIYNDFNVIIDSNNPLFLKKFNVIQLELGIIVPFMNLCGFSVILRSGMADVTNGSSSKRAILYPSHNHKSIFTLSSIESDLIEVVYEENNDWLDSVFNFFI